MFANTDQRISSLYRSVPFQITWLFVSFVRIHFTHMIAPKEWKVCPLKIGRVERQLVDLFLYYLYVCILGYAQPQNWFNPGGVGGGGCILRVVFYYIWLECLFGTVTIGCMPPKPVPILSCVKAWAKNHHFTVFIMIRISQTHFFWKNMFTSIRWEALLWVVTGSIFHQLSKTLFRSSFCKLLALGPL